jgi:hypothetical protein
MLLACSSCTLLSSLHLYAPSTSGDQRPHQDEKRQHLQCRPDRLPPFKPIQFRCQDGFVVGGVFEAEHYRSSLRRRQEVTNARERGDGYWQQQRQGLMPDVGYNCGKKGEQRRADVCWLLGISDPRNVR